MICTEYEDWTVEPRKGHSVRHWPTDRRGIVVEASGSALLFRHADGEEWCAPVDLIVVLTEVLA